MGRMRPLLPSRLLPAWLLALAAVLAACAPTVPEVQRPARYESLLQRPLAERVIPADDAVLDRAHRTNLDYGDDVRPRTAPADHPLAPVVRRVLAELPPEVTRLAEQHLAAVYLVQGDVGTATTEGVQDRQGRWRRAYIALNLTALERDANAWATWKEGSAFRPSEGHDLRMTIEPAASDDRAGAVRFILLHELGHVLGLGLGVHGYWDDPDPVPPLATRLSPFVELSWRLVEEDGKRQFRSEYAASEPRLSGIGFYRFAEAPHTLADAPAIYAALARTNFPSLYGTLNVYDDFAESFAIHVHTALLRKPYRVEVLRGGRPVLVYRSCVATGGCKRKIAQVQALLDGTARGYPQFSEREAPARESGTKVRLHMSGGMGVSR